MSTEHEIRNMLAATPQNYPLVLMACTATYPCPDDQIHLRKMDLLGSLAHQYRRSPKIGFSSHSPSPFPPIYAGLWGADYIEVHVTLDRTMPGSDHAASLELPAVDLLLRELKRQEVILGPDEITVFPDEHEKRKALRGL
jgi:sialic acid synthase SpsE